MSAIHAPANRPHTQPDARGCPNCGGPAYFSACDAHDCNSYACQDCGTGCDLDFTHAHNGGRCANNLPALNPADSDSLADAILIAALINQATRLLETRGWQGSTFVDDDGRLDIHGALNVASGRDPWAGPTPGRAATIDYRLVTVAVHAVCGHIRDDILRWQRRPNLTEADVIRALLDAARRLNDDVVKAVA